MPEHSDTGPEFVGLADSLRLFALAFPLRLFLGVRLFGLDYTRRPYACCPVGIVVRNVDNNNITIGEHRHNTMLTTFRAKPETASVVHFVAGFPLAKVYLLPTVFQFPNLGRG